MNTLVDWSESVQSLDSLIAIFLAAGAISLWAWKKSSRHRLRELYTPMENWWNDFYLHVEDRTQDRRLDQLQWKVTSIIKDSGLENWGFRFGASHRTMLLRSLGIKGALGENRAVFEQWTKLPFDGTDLGAIWLQITLAAHKFRGAHPECTPDTAIQNVENPLKCLKHLVGFKHASNHK